MKLLSRITCLSQIGNKGNGIHRVSGSADDKEARSKVIQWMLEAGLSVTTDDYNNVIGTLPGVGKPIVIGSHIDTVENAGMYDGVLGVLAGIEAVESLRGHVSHPIQVVIFNDEENSMDGSKGFAKDNKDIKAFLELHVEQGPVLDANNVDIGIVQGIVGQRRCGFRVKGRANHAGTTPMHMRDDALVTVAPFIIKCHEKASYMYDGLVATVSQLNVHPNQFSIIPGDVDFTLQVRDLSSDNMEEFVDQISMEFGFEYELLHSSEPAKCDVTIMNHIRSAARYHDLSFLELPSRASHDAQCFTHCPMGMIFVPSVDGISHSPDEYTTKEMCYNGLTVLIETIRRIDGD